MLSLVLHDDFFLCSCGQCSFLVSHGRSDEGRWQQGAEDLYQADKVSTVTAECNKRVTLTVVAGEISHVCSPSSARGCPCSFLADAAIGRDDLGLKLSSKSTRLIQPRGSSLHDDRPRILTALHSAESEETV